MNYIVLDLEWNQGNAYIETQRKEIPFEIIEIGAIRLDDTLRMTGEFSQLVRPQIYREMHNITKKIIHLQMEQLESGRPFVEVCNEFLEWCGTDAIFCTWGPLDLTELQRNMDYYDMTPLSLSPLPFLDVQKLFSIAFEDQKSRRSLEYAIDFLDIEKDIPFHRAFSDAYYTSKILSKIPSEVFSYYSYDLHHIPADRKSEVHIQFDTYAKYISKGFKDKASLLKDKEVTNTKCYLCNKPIRKKIRLFSPNGKHYYAVSTCDTHGYMKTKIRVKKYDENTVYAIKTFKFISEADMKCIEDRALKVKQKHEANETNIFIKKKDM